MHYPGVEKGPALLARGVTTARECGGELEFLVSVRRVLERKNGLGPRLVLAGLIDSGSDMGMGAVRADKAAEGVAAVDLYAEQGFEQVRLGAALTEQTREAAREEAKAKGLGVMENGTDEGPEEEFERAVTEGSSAVAAVEGVTREAARRMKLDGVTGTVEVGKQADFVLVLGNPLVNPVAMRDVVRVVKAGLMWDAKTLAGLAQ